MSSTPPPRFRTVSFGELDGGRWGTALDAGLPAMVYAADGVTGSAAGPHALHWSEEGDGDWRLNGDGLELLVTASTEGPEAVPGDGIVDQLCRVSGALMINGTEHAVDCAATRSAGGGIDPQRLGSVRGVCAWFDGAHAVSLLAFRPRDSAGQEGEKLTATVFEPEGVIRVDEARLSTTYAADGHPTRASLELWIGEGEEQFPRRAAAEALGVSGELDAGGMQLSVTALRCHSRGLDGVGVYTLARL